MFVQGDKANEWLPVLDWQIKVKNTPPNFYFTNIKTDRIYSDRGQTIIKYNSFTYVLYYKYGDYQGYDIPILLNLNTGKSRLIYGSNDKKHSGARFDHIIANKFKKLLIGKSIPNIKD